jgi:hypothetical protein
MQYWVKKFDGREHAFISMRDIGFTNLALYEDEYYYYSLQADDKHFTGMAELDVDLENWLAISERWDHFKLYRLIWVPPHNLESVPYDVDYVTGLTQRLHPVETYERGRIVRIDYFLNAGLDAYGEKYGTDLFVTESFDYTNNAGGFAVSRVQVISWYLEDGTVGGTKERHKLYNTKDSRAEGRRRRRNVIDISSMNVIKLLAGTETGGDINAAVIMGVTFMAGYKLQTEAYLEMATNDLYTAVLSNTTASWLNNVINAEGATIRMYLAGELV